MYPGDSGRRTSVPSGMVSLVYASAALGVIHDLATNKQTFFAGHDDDITCICLSNSSLLAATGQMGKTPVIHVWRTDVTQSSNTRKATLAINSNTAGNWSILIRLTQISLFVSFLPCLHIYCHQENISSQKLNRTYNFIILFLEGESDLVVTLGKGFLTRSVCAVSFCSDDTFLAGVGCDDHHSLGIW